MKKGLLALLLVSSYAANAQEYRSYSEIADAVSHGKNLSFVFNLKECTGDSELPAVSVSIRPNAVLVTDEKITASDKHFTLDDPDHKSVPVYAYSKFNIDTQGDVTINFRKMFALTYTVIDQKYVDCQLGRGFKVFS